MTPTQCTLQSLNWDLCAIFQAEERMADTARANAERLTRDMKERSGVTLGFDLASIAALDAYIGRLADEWMEESVDYLKLTVGTYFGECIRRAFGGRWSFDARLKTWSISVANTQLFPREAVMNRYLNGSEDSLLVLWEALPRLLARGR